MIGKWIGQEYIEHLQDQIEKLREENAKYKAVVEVAKEYVWNFNNMPVTNVHAFFVKLEKALRELEGGE